MENDMELPGDIYDLATSHSVADYKRAFLGCSRLLRTGSKYRGMLEANWSAPSQTVSSSELASAIGWTDWRPANLHYGRLASAVARRLGHTPGRLPGIGVPRTVNIAALVSFSGGPGTGKDVQWTLLPAAAQALEELGVVSNHGL